MIRTDPLELSDPGIAWFGLTLMDMEHRKYSRKKTEHVSHAKLPIALLDVSRTGAQISVDSATRLPDEFVLQISANLARWCRVKWRDGERMGVEFIDPREVLPSTAIGSAKG